MFLKCKIVLCCILLELRSTFIYALKIVENVTTVCTGGMWEVFKPEVSTSI